MEEQYFEELVTEGIALIPERFRKLLKNVAIVIEDSPTPTQLHRGKVPPGSTLLGLYEGVPRARRFGQDPVLPDKITIFRLPIVAIARTPEQIRRAVAQTVWHEIGHYFGLSEHAVRCAEKRRKIS